MKNFLRHVFIPHESNNHRAKALHINAMLLYAAVLVFFNVAIRSIHNTYPEVLGYATNIQIQNLLTETNARRVQAGLKPLVLNQQLSQAAAAKAADMFHKDYWAHISPDGKTPWDFITGAGYTYTVAGENLAKNFQDSIGVVNAWMNSPSHRDNLLKSSYKEIGFAVMNGMLQGEETTLVVQMFGTKPGGLVLEAPNTETSAPVAIPQVASVSQTQPLALVLPFSEMIKTPKIDIITLKRDVTMIFAGTLLGIFVVDMYVALRKRTVRAVGASVAHVFFLMAMMVSINIVLKGAIL